MWSGVTVKALAEVARKAGLQAWNVDFILQPSPPLPEVQASEPVVIVAQPFPRGGGGRVPTQLKKRGKPTRKRQVETSP